MRAERVRALEALARIHRFETFYDSVQSRPGPASAAAVMRLRRYWRSLPPWYRDRSAR